MASEQMSRRRDDTTDERDGVQVEKDRVPKMASHFEHLAEEAKGPSPRKEQKSHELVSLADEQKETSERTGRDFAVGKFETEDKDRSTKEEGGQRAELSLEEIARLRAIAQQKSTEAIRAAQEKYTRALQAAKDYTVEKGAEAKEATVETAGSVKEKAVAAGWTAAHFSAEKTVEGTAAVARAVGYAGSKTAELAAKPFTAAKDVAVSAGESAKDYTARKMEEAKHRSTGTQETEISATTTTDQSQSDYDRNSRMERDEERTKGSSGGTTVLGAIGETIAEIAQTTKDLVIGGEDQTTQQQKPHPSADQS